MQNLTYYETDVLVLFLICSEIFRSRTLMYSMLSDIINEINVKFQPNSWKVILAGDWKSFTVLNSHLGDTGNIRAAKIDTSLFLNNW